MKAHNNVAGFQFKTKVFTAVVITNRLLQMGVGPVSLVSQLVAQSVPACSKVCIFKTIPVNSTVAPFVDPYPNACPTTCLSNQTLNWNPNYGNQASTIALMVGVIMTVLAPVLGWAMNFVPSPIIMGFTSGGGVIIAMGQLKNVMGNSIRTDVLQNGVYDLFNLPYNTTTATMGWIAVAFLFFHRKLGQGRILWWKVKAIPEWVKQVCLLPWAFGLVVLYTGITAQLDLSGTAGVAIVKTIPPGLPPITVRLLTTARTRISVAVRFASPRVVLCLCRARDYYEAAVPVPAPVPAPLPANVSAIIMPKL